MKKYLTLILTAACLATLVGCRFNSGGNSNNGGSSDSGDKGDGGDTPTPSGDTVTYNEQSSSAKASTIKAMLNECGKASNKKTLYRIKGIAQWPRNTTYGNFDLLDSTGYVYVYGCAKNKSTLTGSSGSYAFSNDKSYSSMGIKPGDEVEMEGLFTWYAYSSGYGVAEFQGYVTTIKHNNLSNIEAKSYTTSEPTNQAGTYYSSISDSESSSTLLTSLHNLMDTTHKTYVSYSSLDSYFRTSDKHSSGNVKCFYSGKNTSSFNKEHVWPQSCSGSSSNQLYGTSYGGSDLHHIRPTISSYNSARGSSMYGPIYGDKTSVGTLHYSTGGSNYYTGNVYEPADAIKGDVARIIMYMYVHYSSEIGGNSQSYYGEMHINYVMGTSPQNSWKLLRKWNAEDPVSEDEITRNNYAYSIQGNRNPFIDHPTYADRIWG